MSEMKHLIFGEGLLIPTVAGKKKTTLRKYRAGSHDFVAGEIIRGYFKDDRDQWSILLRITADTKKKPFLELTDQEAQESGFRNVLNAFNGLRLYYPGLAETDTMAIIRFEILQINGIPVVSLA